MKIAYLFVMVLAGCTNTLSMYRKWETTEPLVRSRKIIDATVYLSKLAQSCTIETPRDMIVQENVIGHGNKVAKNMYIYQSCTIFECSNIYVKHSLDISPKTKVKFGLTVDIGSMHKGGAYMGYVKCMPIGTQLAALRVLDYGMLEFLGCKEPEPEEIDGIEIYGDWFELMAALNEGVAQTESFDTLVTFLEKKFPDFKRRIPRVEVPKKELSFIPWAIKTLMGWHY